MRPLPAVLAAILLVAVGCGSVPAEDTGPGTPSRSAGRSTVSFMVSGDPAELKAYETLVEAFERERPGIDIRLIHVPGQSDYRTRLGNDLAAGTPSDVVLINYRRFASFAQRGLLEPLDRYLRRSAVLSTDAFYPATLEAFRWRGVVTCLPQNLSSLVVYYNEALFDAAGLPYPRADWDWDEFLRTARALTVDEDGDGRPEQYGLGTEASLFRLAPFIWQNGAEIVEGQPEPHRLALDRPEALDAFRWFVDLQVRHHVVPGAVEERSEDSESRFQNGRTAMYLNSRRGVPTYRAVAGLRWDVAPLPGNRQRAGILHSDAYCMPAVVRDKDAVWEFIEYANSPVGQRLVAASGRTVPSLRAVAESAAFLDPATRPANDRVFLDGIDVIRAVPVLAGWAEIEDLASDEIERAFYGQVSVEEAARAAVERTLPLFAE